MKKFRTIGVAGFAACIGVALMPSLQADEWDKKTTLTVSEPIEVPACCNASHTVLLQPGDYVVKLNDSQADRHIVRIYDKDQKHLITTILAVPNYRLRPTGKTVLQFWEVPAGQPRAVRAWFYPGDNFGQEFVYPKQQATQIAGYSKTSVPSSETTAEEQMKTAPVESIDESGKSTKYEPTTPEPAPAPVEAQATPPPAPAQPEPSANRSAEPEPAPTPAPAQSLPATGSNMPLIGLAGMISLVLFAAVRFLDRRRRSSEN
jgi:LPXTG-motif cell wall-anchored protein